LGTDIDFEQVQFHDDVAKSWDRDAMAAGGHHWAVSDETAIYAGSAPKILEDML